MTCFESPRAAKSELMPLLSSVCVGGWSWDQEKGLDSVLELVRSACLLVHLGGSGGEMQKVRCEHWIGFVGNNDLDFFQGIIWGLV